MTLRALTMNNVLEIIQLPFSRLRGQVVRSADIINALNHSVSGMGSSPMWGTCETAN